DVAAPRGVLGDPPTPFGEGSHAHRETRHTGHRADLSNEHHRVVEPVRASEAWRVVDDLDGAAVLCEEGRRHYRCVGQVVLLARHESFELDLTDAVLVEGGFEERAEGRIGGEVGQAAPYVPAATVDEHPDRAVSDHCQIK